MDAFIGFSLLEMEGSPYLTVNSVWVTGPAARVGIELGDTVTSIGGQPVESLAAAKLAIAAKGRVGDHLQLTFVPADESTPVDVVVLVLTCDSRAKDLVPALYYNRDEAVRLMSPPRSDWDDGEGSGSVPRGGGGEGSPGPPSQPAAS